MKPPAVVLDQDGAEVQFDGIRQWHILWSQIREIIVEVTVMRDIGDSEAFWHLEGDGVKFMAPVEIVMGAEALKARLFAFPGFDQASFQRAMEAEKQARPGEFVCWRGHLSG